MCVAFLSNLITGRRNSIVGQFLQRCLAKDPENRPYPYDLYTFFAGQCSAESAIHFGGDEGTYVRTSGVWSRPGSGLYNFACVSA